MPDREGLPQMKAQFQGSAQVPVRVQFPLTLKHITQLIEFVLLTYNLVNEGQEFEGDLPEPAHRQARKYPPYPQVVVRVDQECQCESFHADEPQFTVQPQPDAQEVEEDHHRFEQSQPYDRGVPEKLGLQVAEGFGLPVEHRLEVVRKHGLNVVVTILQEIVVLKPGMQAPDAIQPCLHVEVVVVEVRLAAQGQLATRFRDHTQVDQASGSVGWQSLHFQVDLILAYCLIRGHLFGIYPEVQRCEEQSTTQHCVLLDYLGILQGQLLGEIVLLFLHGQAQQHSHVSIVLILVDQSLQLLIQ